MLIFDGAEDTSPPPTHKVRRNLHDEIAELERQLAESQARELAARELTGESPAEIPQAEKTKTWSQVSEVLPKNAGGDVDWVQAMVDGVIAPRAAVNPATPEQAVFNLDVKLARSGIDAFAVTYPHAPHTELLSCDSCHPAIFPLSREIEPTRITMAAINDGQYCGECHGTVAFAPEQGCPRCHEGLAFSQVAWQPADQPRTPIEHVTTWDEAMKLLPVTGGGADWVKALNDGVIVPRPGARADAVDMPVLPVDVERIPAAGAAFKVHFPHAAHTQLLSCTTCHTDIFQMQKGATPMSMEMIYNGEACGVCHGKVSFAAQDACARCHTGIPAGQKWRPSEAPRTPIERVRSWQAAEKLLPVNTGGPDWVKAQADGVIAPRAGPKSDAAHQPVLPIDIERIPAANPMLKVVFSHAAHTQLLSCATCHTDIFEMRRGSTEITMEKIFAGETCGACHGTVAFAPQACARCHVSLGGG